MDQAVLIYREYPKNISLKADCLPLNRQKMDLAEYVNFGYGPIFWRRERDEIRHVKYWRPLPEGPEE
jgi:hypothetical protein